MRSFQIFIASVLSLVEGGYSLLPCPLPDVPTHRDSIDNSHIVDLKRSMTPAPGSNLTHIIIDMKFKNPVDNETTSCHLDGNADTGPTSFDKIFGTCTYPKGGPLGPVIADVSYYLLDGDPYFHTDMTFGCIGTEHERPYEAHLYGNAFTEDKDWICDASGQNCHIDYDKPGTYDIMINGIDILVPPPLTNCSEASLSKPKWELRGLNFDMEIYTNASRQGRHPPPADALSAAQLNAELYFDNLDMRYWCGYSGYTLGPINPPKYTKNDWYSCYGQLNSAPDTVVTRSTFDPRNFHFAVTQDWSCDDGPNGPVHFSGIANQTMHLNCGEQQGGGGLSCYLEHPVELSPVVTTT